MAIFKGAGVAIVTPMKENGDVDFEAVKEVAGAITPVPGGVGSVTTAILLNHVVVAAIKLNDIQD